MKKIFNFIAAAFSLVVLYFLFTIFRSGFLPSNYYFILAFLVLIICTFIVIGITYFKNKKVKVFSTFLALLVSVVMVVGLRYSSNTLNFLRNMTGLEFETTKYYGLALKDSNHNEIDGLNVLLHNNMADEMSLLKDELNEKNTTISETNILGDIDTKLFNNEYDAVVVEKNFRDILNESNNLFEEETIVIFEFEVRNRVVREDTDVDVTNDPFSIYISGIDTHGSISNRARSDVNIVMTINPKTKEILLISIPRDYYVRIPGTTGYKDKLTHTGIYGVDVSKNTVSQLLETDIEFYLRVNFSSTVRLVDALGGINVDSNYAFSAKGYSFNRGNNFMDGEKALVFVRQRNNLPGGDRARGENQQAVIEGLINKTTQRDVITRYNSILNSMDGMFDTNMSSDDIVSLIRMQISDNANWSIEQYNLDGSDSSDFTYSNPSSRAYVMEPDMETVNEAIRLIRQVKED